MNFEKEMLIVLFAILFVWLLMGFNRKERFDVTGCKFLPIGEPQYGLRGDLLRTRSILGNFIKDDPNVRLHHTNGMMYESDNTPEQDGILGCNKVDCPCTADNYFKGSPCWKCTGSGLVKQEIPPIHPHVRN